MASMVYNWESDQVGGGVDDIDDDSDDGGDDYDIDDDDSDDGGDD